MPQRTAAIIAPLAIAAAGWAAQGAERTEVEQAPPAATVPATPPQEQLGPRERPRSRALGLPFRRGRLVGGIPFPPVGAHHLTWDPVLDQSPNRVWRRYGTDRTVIRVLKIVTEFRTAHPEAPPVLVGDLSRPRGGEFGARFGGLGHASHQNGLDVDVYYPRLDRLPIAPRRAREVDRRLAQELVDAFVAAGATDVFVGPRVGLRGPRGIVQRLVHHDDHLHARFGR